MEQISVAEILQLSIQERIRLVELIWDSIAAIPEAVEVAPELKAELESIRRKVHVVGAERRRNNLTAPIVTIRTESNPPLGKAKSIFGASPHRRAHAACDACFGGAAIAAAAAPRWCELTTKLCCLALA